MNSSLVALDEALAFLNGSKSSSEISIASITEAAIIEAENEVALFIENGFVLEANASIGAKIKEIVARVIEFIKKTFMKIKSLFQKLSIKIKAATADKLVEKIKTINKSKNIDSIKVKSKYGDLEKAAVDIVDALESADNAGDALDNLLDDLKSQDPSEDLVKDLDTQLSDISSKIDKSKEALNSFKKNLSSGENEVSVGDLLDFFSANSAKSAGEDAIKEFKDFEDECNKFISSAKAIESKYNKSGSGSYTVNIVSKTMSITTKFMSVHAQAMTVIFDFTFDNIKCLYQAVKKASPNSSKNDNEDDK